MPIRVIGSPRPLVFYSGGKNVWGKTPHKKPLFRIVWSESVDWQLGGEWGDGAIEYRWVPRYLGRKEWILEKWLSAQEYAGSREEWEKYKDHTGLYEMGPYPAMGQYEQCYSYKPGEVPDIEGIAQILEHSKNTYDFARTQTAIRLWHMNRRQEWSDRVQEEMAELQPAFGDRATNLSSAKPTGDTAGLSQPGALSTEIAKHRGRSSKTKTPKLLKMPPRGVSFGQVQ